MCRSIRPRLVAGLAVAIALLLNAGVVRAQVGELSIKGKIWDGFGTGLIQAPELKVKCKDIGGPQLADISVDGQRTFTLHFHPDCFVFADACETCASGTPPATADMVFTGEEIVVEANNGNPKPFRQISAVLTSPVFASGSIQGSIAAKVKCSDPFDSATCKVEKGTITYSRFNPDSGGNVKVFIGKYKVKYQ